MFYQSGERVPAAGCLEQETQLLFEEVAHTSRMSQQKSAFDSMSRDDLLRALQMLPKNWLAHDGCWFLAAEERLGMEAAVELDSRSWKRFAAPDARRIMTTFNIPEAGGLQGLERALSLRLYAVINSQSVEWSGDCKHLRFFMDVCRVQETRRRRGSGGFSL